MMMPMAEQTWKAQRTFEAKKAKNTLQMCLVCKALGYNYPNKIPNYKKLTVSLKSELILPRAICLVLTFF